MSDNWSPVRTPIGHAGNGWTAKRKFRLLRTITAVLLIVWLIGRCTGDDDTTTPEDTVGVDAEGPGGEDETTSQEQVDPTSLSASVLDVTLSEPRYQSGAVPLGDVILLPGGLDETRNSTSSILRFEPTAPGSDPAGPSGEVTEIGSLPAELHKAMSSRIGERVFVYGGAKGNIRYDVVSSIDASGESASVARLPNPRSDGVAVTSEVDGATLIVGGTDGNEPLLDVLRTTDGENFEVVAQLAEPTRYPAVVMNGSSIFVMGGTWEGTDSNSIQRVDLTSGTTRIVGTLPDRTSHAMGFSIGGSLFMAGGLIGDARTNAIVRIDPATGASSDAGTLPTRLSDAGVATVGGVIYLLGGLTPEVTDNIVAVEPAGRL